MLLLLQVSLAGGAAQVQHGARRPGERVHGSLDVGVELLRVVARVVLRDDLLEEKLQSEMELVCTFALLGSTKRASRREIGWFVPADGTCASCPQQLLQWASWGH